MKTQKQTIFILLIIALTIIFPSCGKKNRALEEALSFVGDNPQPQTMPNKKYSNKTIDMFCNIKESPVKLNMTAMVTN